VVKFCAALAVFCLFMAVPWVQAQTGSEAIKIDGAALAKDYASDKKAADTKYKGKVLEVTGTLKSEGGIQSGVVVVDTGSKISIVCNFDKDGRADLERVRAKLRKGTKLVIRGTCKGSLSSFSVDLEKCKLLEPSPTK
jgi:hypothetical protein